MAFKYGEEYSSSVLKTSTRPLNERIPDRLQLFTFECLDGDFVTGCGAALKRQFQTIDDFSTEYPGQPMPVKCSKSHISEIIETLSYWGDSWSLSRSDILIMLAPKRNTYICPYVDGFTTQQHEELAARLTEAERSDLLEIREAKQLPRLPERGIGRYIACAWLMNYSDPTKLLRYLPDHPSFAVIHCNSVSQEVINYIYSHKFDKDEGPAPEVLTDVTEFLCSIITRSHIYTSTKLPEEIRLHILAILGYIYVPGVYFPYQTKPQLSFLSPEITDKLGI
jgi:hypothetical protein